MHAKVNPPIRPREDVEALWQAVLDRKIDWIVSDHACCSAEQKWSKDDPDNIWLAKSGFGGTEYLLSGVVSEGSKRGLSYNRMAELLSWNPARRFGLLNKGDIAPGFDADIVLVDPNETFTVHSAEFGVGAGLFAVRGPGAQRPGEEHVPARRAGLSQRQRRRPGARPLSASADQIAEATFRPVPPNSALTTPRNCRPRRGDSPTRLKYFEVGLRHHCRRGFLLLNETADIQSNEAIGLNLGVSEDILGDVEMYRGTKDIMLPTTITGSLPRPSWYTENLGTRMFLDAMVSRRYREQYVDTLSCYLRDQEIAGLDIVTDGDCRFDDDVGGQSWTSYPPHHMTGYERGDPRPTPAGRGGLWFPRGHILHDYLESRVMPVIIGPVGRGDLQYTDVVEDGAAAHHAAGEIRRGVGGDRRLRFAGPILQERARAHAGDRRRLQRRI